MNILKIDSSILGDNSVSRKLTSSIVQSMLEKHPSAQVVKLDLAKDVVPFFTADSFALSVDSKTLNEQQKAQNAVTEKALAELFAADVIVIGAPLYNFSIPTQLRSWVDRVLVAGRTFSYGEKGPVGLVTGKKAILALSRGGVYSTSDWGNAAEHQESYLKTILGFIGITDVQVVRAEGVSMGQEGVEKAFANTNSEISQLSI